jgi:hypothetical protein
MTGQPPVYLTQPPIRNTQPEVHMSDLFQHITYSQRTKYADDVVTKRMTKLGIPTDVVTDDQFTNGQVSEEMEALSDYAKYADAATLAEGDYSPDQIIAFAKLASAMGAMVTVANYQGLKVRNLKAEDARRASALANLRDKLTNERRDAAIRTLLEEDPEEMAKEVTKAS